MYIELCLQFPTLLRPTLLLVLQDNGLALNGDKSAEITFGTRQKLRTYPSSLGISIAGTTVSLSYDI